jgi:hypothetical protein
MEDDDGEDEDKNDAHDGLDYQDEDDDVDDERTRMIGKHQRTNPFLTSFSVASGCGRYIICCNSSDTATSDTDERRHLAKAATTATTAPSCQQKERRYQGFRAVNQPPSLLHVGISAETIVATPRGGVSIVFSLTLSVVCESRVCVYGWQQR